MKRTALLLATALGCGNNIASNHTDDDAAQPGPDGGGQGGVGGNGGGGSPPGPDAGGSGGGGVGIADDPRVVAESIWEFTSKDQTMPGGDLSPLKGIIGDSRVVAFGETTHTVGGYFEMKARIFRYLVTEMGFRGMSFETPWLWSEPLAEYVRTCQGDLRNIMFANIFRIWKSYEVLDLFKWMCEYNQAHADDPLVYFGLDEQEPWYAGPALKKFLEKVAPAKQADWLARLNRCDGVNSGSQSTHNYGAAYTDADWMACLSMLDETAAWLKAERAAVVAKSSADEVDYAALYALSVRAWQATKRYEQNMTPANEFQDLEQRDRAMATIFEELWRMRAKNKPTFIWAQNGHIAYQEGSAGNMGGFLAKDIGKDYVPISLTGWSVYANWPGVTCGLQPRPPASSLEGKLHALGKPYLLVDLTFPGAKMPLVSPTSYSRSYRGAVFMEEAPAMKALFWSKCTP